MIKIFKEVQQDSRLKNLEERIIVNHVLDWDSQGKDCFSSNAFIGGLIARSQDEVANLIQSLVQRKILSQNCALLGNARCLRIWREEREETTLDFDIFDQVGS